MISLLWDGSFKHFLQNYEHKLVSLLCFLNVWIFRYVLEPAEECRRTWDTAGSCKAIPQGRLFLKMVSQPKYSWTGNARNWSAPSPRNK